MTDLKAVANLVRWGAESMAFNLGQLPADKLDWKPTPESKSALDVAGEVIGVMQMSMPLFRGEGLQPSPAPKPASLDEARQQLSDVSEQFAKALENAGPELDRVHDTPFGQLWGPRAVTFGLVDLIHHHGQITYIQSLLGDAENHLEPQMISRWFGPQR